MKKFTALSLVLAFAAAPAFAADVKSYDLVIKDHKFTPETIEVPAGEKFQLNIKNQDATAEEFDSHDLKREKVIQGNGAATVLVGPLKAGEYKFEGEYHDDTAQGKIVAK